LDLHWENPLAERWAVVASGRFDWDAFGERSEASGGLKRALHSGRNSALSGQISAIWRDETFGRCGEAGGEARLMAGRSLGKNQNSFLDVAPAQHVFSGGCSGAKIEATYGVRPHARWLTLGQVFYDSGLHGADTLKGQINAVRFGAAGGLQAGVRVRLDGGDPDPRLVIGLWRRTAKP
jgi:hypothetical protein